MINKNKHQVVIVGMSPVGLSAHAQAILHASVSAGEVILVGSLDELKEKTGIDPESLPKEVKENPFESPPIPIKPYNMDLSDIIPISHADLMNSNNPWPSPKGRKGRRKW